MCARRGAESAPSLTCRAVAQASYAMVGWSPNVVVYLLGNLSSSIATSTVYVIITSTMQACTSDEYRGRVMAVSLCLRFISSAVGSFLAGYLLDLPALHDDVRTVTGIFALISTTIALVYMYGYLPVFARQIVSGERAMWSEHDNRAPPA